MFIELYAPEAAPELLVTSWLHELDARKLGSETGFEVKDNETMETEETEETEEVDEVEIVDEDIVEVEETLVEDTTEVGLEIEDTAFDDVERVEEVVVESSVELDWAEADVEGEEMVWLV